MEHTDISALFKEPQNFEGKTVAVCGWVRTFRESKNVSFLEINDGTTIRNLQLVADRERLDPKSVSGATSVGASVEAKGRIVPSRDGVEMDLETLSLLGECPSDFPLQKKRHTLEYLRTVPHLRPRTKYFEAIFTVRDELSFAIHSYFHKNGFKYVPTPIISGSDCEGAGEMFRVTTNDWNFKPESEKECYERDFFGTKANLSVSGQLEGEMAAMGLGRIYTFGPTFRAEHSNTTRHAAEFWQVEPEVCFADLDDIIRIAEDFIKSIIRDCMENCSEELTYLSTANEEDLIGKLEKVVSSDFGRITYTEAVELLKKADEKFKYPVSWGMDLQTEHERYLCEKVFSRPLFVTDYPESIKAFYMKLNPDGETVAATDLLVPGVGEIIGCSEREADYDKLLAAMKKRNMPLEAYSRYLDTRKYGSVPHSGFGLGLERMTMYVTGAKNIRDVLLFPRTDGNLS